MDDDDLRRGRPTTHRAYDEATAILVGDSLLTLAFDVLADERTDPDPAIRIALVGALARAAGIGGMAGGQMLDLEAEGRFTADGVRLRWRDRNPPPAGDEDRRAAHRLQSRWARSSAAPTARPRGAPRLSATCSARRFRSPTICSTWKPTPRPSARQPARIRGKGKATLVGLWGVGAARQRLAGLVAEAEKALAGFGAKADVLRQAARFVAERKS